MMKRFSFLQMGLIVALMVLAASCTVTRGYDDYYENDRRASRYGNQVVVVERDPYTGRYYEVDRYGNYLGTLPMGMYDRYYNNRYYGGYYGGYSRNNIPRTNNNSQQQAEQRREEGQKKINEARDVIRGKRN